MTPTEFRQAREATDLSVRALADRLKVAPSSVFRWEKGARRIPSDVADRLRELANERVTK